MRALLDFSKNKASSDKKSVIGSYKPFKTLPCPVSHSDITGGSHHPDELNLNAFGMMMMIWWTIDISIVIFTNLLQKALFKLQ